MKLGKRRLPGDGSPSQAGARDPAIGGDTLDNAAPSAGEPRGFAPLLAVRGLTLVNDHALKWLAIGLGKRLVRAARARSAVSQRAARSPCTSSHWSWPAWHGAW